MLFYVYQLIDPRNNFPFYIGKGSGNRAQSHLREIPDTRNVYKENKINSIRKNGLEPVIEYIFTNIVDEKTAYDLETKLILKYGRKGYEHYGILTNICIDGRPPNHKGKSYQDIYGEGWEEQVEKRRQLQLDAGGYGPEKHSEETKRKLKVAVNKRKINGYLITEKELLTLGEQFCRDFDYKISFAKWLWWCKDNNIKSKNIRNTFRFDGKDLLDVFCENFNATRVRFENMLWYTNTLTGKNIRIDEWKIGRIGIPEGFIPGRSNMNWV